jgi:PAS domain-containing protein
MNLDPLAILNALPEATLLRDAAGVVRHVNPAAERLLQVRAADVVGGRDLPHVSAEQLDSGEAQFEIYTFEVPLSLEFLPVDGGGSLVLYRDRSWQRDLESYLGTMRFDLLTPLISAGHAVDLVRRMRATLTEQQQDEILAIASRNGLIAKLEMLFLHDQIRYENLAGSLHIAAENLAEMMRQAMEPLQQAYDFTEIQIDSDREPPPVRCDRGRMLFVLRALFRHVSSLQDRQLHITFSLEDQYLAINCIISHSSMPYRSNFTHRDLCQRLLEQQSGMFEFTVASETTQHCLIRLPIASDPPAA